MVLIVQFISFVTFCIAETFYINNSVNGNSLRVKETWEDCRGTRVIVGGDPIDINKAPFMLAIESFYLSWEFKCGASIITRAVAITAAHCVSPVGSAIRTEGSIHLIRKIIVHRDYDPYTSASNNDIALLFVFEHFVFSNVVNPLQLPKRELAPGTETYVTGWGEQNPNFPRKPSMHLKRAMVPIVKWKTCQHIYERISNSSPGVRLKVTENMICAGFPGGKADACQGDSGGPQYANNTLYGLVSWGWGCARPCTPGVYTNVYRYVHWIDQEILKDRTEWPLVESS